MIYKSIIIPVHCSETDKNYLQSVNTESAKIWNKCVELDYLFKGEHGRFMRYMEIQKALLGFSILHRVGVYHVFRKYLSARSSMWNSILQKHSSSHLVQLPYKTKKYFPTGWNYQGITVNYDLGTISLCKKIGVDENGKRYHQKPVVCYAKTIPQNIVEIELLYRDGLKLAIKYKEPDIEHLIPSGNSAAIDLGEIHSITAIDKGAHAIIITGRKLRSIKRYRDKEQAALRAKMSHCTKGSRQYKKYARAMWKLRNKADNQIKDAVHKTTKLFLDYCIQNNVTTVYYGDLDGCTRNTKGKVKAHVGQKLNEWCYGRIVQQLENKLGRYGIELIKVSEAYSSQTCPVCGSLNKPTSRNYSCSCGYEQHRDIVGAMNLLNTNAGTEIRRYSDKMYLRLA